MESWLCGTQHSRCLHKLLQLCLSSVQFKIQCVSRLSRCNLFWCNQALPTRGSHSHLPCTTTHQVV